MRILLAFLLGLVLASCAPASIPKNATTVISSGDTVPMFTTRITMPCRVIHEMPNWIQTDPFDSTHPRPLRYSAAGSIVKIAR